MGFVISFWCRTFVRYYMTVLVVNGFWRYHGFIAHGALDQSSQEQILPYFENHNHVQEDGHAHDDGWCDCNAQGPWHPLFKPSQAVRAVGSEEITTDLENAIDASEHGHVHAVPHDLHTHFPPPNLANLRKSKKQNHMIHLHLIPHIYVPVLHPVRHPVTYSVQNSHHNSHESLNSHETHPYSFEHEDSNGLSLEQDNNIGLQGDHSSEQTMHHDDHSPFVPPEPTQDLSQETVHHDVPDYINSHSLGYTSHESDELAHNTLPGLNYHYPHNNEDQNSHQYQVHEDSTNEHFYGDYPSGSNTRSQILPLNSSSVNYFKVKSKQKYQDRSQLNKKFMVFPIQVKKLRVMRPPPPAQQETWRTNLEQADPKLIPLKAFFDSKNLFKHPFFDFKGLKPSFPLMHPQMTQPLKPILPMAQPAMGNLLSLPQATPGKHLQSPYLVYPTNVLRRRRDKILRS